MKKEIDPPSYFWAADEYYRTGILPKPRKERYPSFLLKIIQIKPYFYYAINCYGNYKYFVG